jgi:aldehyde:ferredoxin oxidoreductase
LPKDLDAMLDAYCGLRGWTREGIPTDEKLADLGLL